MVDNVSNQNLIKDVQYELGRPQSWGKGTVPYLETREKKRAWQNGLRSGGNERNGRIELRGKNVDDRNLVGEKTGMTAIDATLVTFWEGRCFDNINIIVNITVYYKMSLFGGLSGRRSPLLSPPSPRHLRPNLCLCLTRAHWTKIQLLGKELYKSVQLWTQ